MAGKITIAELSALISANAGPLVAEMQRASGSARQESKTIREEIDHIVDHMTNSARGFSASGFAHGLLAGFGVGGGAQIVELTLGKWKELFEADTKAMEEMNKQADTLAASFERLGRVRFENLVSGLQGNDKLAALQRDADAAKVKQDKLTAALSDAKRDLAKLSAPGNEMQPLYDKYADGNQFMSPEALFGVINSKATSIQEELNKVTETAIAAGTKVQEVQKQIADSNEKDLKKSYDEIGKSIDAYLKGTLDPQLKAEHEVLVAHEKHEAELEKLAEHYRELADPTLVYKNQIAEIEMLHGKGVLTAEQYAGALDAVNRAMNADEVKRVNTALNDFFGEMDAREKETTKVSDAAHELGYAFQSAFENAVIGGEKFSDVLRGLAQDLEKIWLRKNITDPLVKGLEGGGGAGILSSIGGFFGFATGGDFTVGGAGGTDSQLVAFRASPGESISVRPPAQAGGGDGGANIYQTFNFASGVTRQEVAALVPHLVEASKNAVVQAVTRGGAYRKAFA